MSYITTGERIGYERGQQELVLRLLQKRVGELPEEVKKQVQSLSLQELEALGEALLDFTTMDDLLDWLQQHLNQTEN
ncbi:DUF4351 domain-containing protein [Nostoc paludosum FACHB-159]|uniref:DUF4351 domain-containing protein n=1 Tax=Nostoc paludosum FACHB-159 TaxID=2692908 RepID=A0ABR8K747_9NOSO|nr:DUF4351 domain-containing protein [Nostoc sp. FACHB-857]MBD2734763.1 DUF4351 domain-containing protein [Nostoc paludosum FACHB-159]